MTDQQNHFRRLWDLGYKRLVPIIPPDAPLSERSSLHRRLNAKTPHDDRGKVPGVKWADGTWSGFDWVPHEASETDLDRWNGMGAGVGIKTGSGLALIDADTWHEDRAKIIRDIIKEELGFLPPVRVGQYPKAGYLIRTTCPYLRIEFGERDERGRLKERVEILGEGRQFVAHGIHPKTGKPYKWPKGLPPIEEIPVVTREQLERILKRCAEALPSASPLIVEGAGNGEAPDQSTLRGSMETLRQAVAAIANTSEQFPSRESYRDFGYAVKAAAGPEHEAEALELFLDWCGRWQDGENDLDVARADWGRMKGPFRRGASWLYELAGFDPKLQTAERWFEELPESIFSPDPSDGEARSVDDLYDVLTVDALFNRPDPQFLIDRHVPEQSVGFLYGDPGTGKSFIALDWALHLAFDRPDWHGDALRPVPGAAVIYLAGEGASGFKTRVAAWMARRGVPAGQRGRFGLIHQSVNFMQPDDVKRLVRTLRQRVQIPVSAVVVDTVSRAMPGADENLQKEMTLFVKACDMVKEAFQCAVIGVHHAGKSGDMRGSTVLRGAGDFVFKLERKKGHMVGHLHCEKQKDAPDGWSEPYRFDVVQLGGDKSSLVPTRCEAGGASDATLTPDVSAAVLSAMREAWDAGAPWGRTYHAGDRMAARRMTQDFGFEIDSATQILDVWLGSGVIEERVSSTKNKRKGLFVVHNDIQQSEPGGVFE